MSSFRCPGPLYPDGNSSLEPARNVEPAKHSLSLPPLRSIDPLQRLTTLPAQKPGPTAQLALTGLPPIRQHHPQVSGISQCNSASSGYPLVGNYLELGASAVQMNLLPSPTLLPIPPSESHRFMSGGRHQKEIKRRTKTGCLTCRRRRIKVSHLSTEAQKRWRVVGAA